MSTAIATRNGNGNGHGVAAATLETVLVRGDLTPLTPEQRGQYYAAVCHSVGLNPLTKPFEYLTLNGRTVLYALRNCTDQLRSIHRISVVEMTEAERDGVCVVTCKVSNSEGRTDMAKGAVHIANLKGEALANALMKAETKAKRRATLSICGLSLLDETEVEDIPANVKRPNPHVNQPGDFVDIPTDPADMVAEGDAGAKRLLVKDQRPLYAEMQKEMYATKTRAELQKWRETRRADAQQLSDKWREILNGEYKKHKDALPPEASQAEHVITERKGYTLSTMQPKKDEPPSDPKQLVKWVDTVLSDVTEAELLEPTWDFRVEILTHGLSESTRTELLAIYKKHEQRLGID